MKTGWVSVGVVLLCCPAAVLADDVQFSASAAINFKTGQYVPHVDPDTGFKFKNKTLDLGFTAYTSRFYVALNYDSTIKEDYTVTNRGTIEVETTRLDQGAAVGYDIGRGFGAFIGFKVGETEQEAVRTTGSTSTSISYYDKGPFAGVSYAYNFGKSGSISLSVAYADMDGRVSGKNNLTNVIQQTTGTTSGLSYGVKWSKEIRDGRTLAIGYKRQDYHFKDKALALGASQDLDQTFDVLYVQLSEFFN